MDKTDSLLDSLKNFLHTQNPEKKPLILALSGGSDSLALLYALLECNLNYPLHLAHVNHNWREESLSEERTLQQLAEKLQLPYHSTTLDPKIFIGNQEAVSRSARYQFFANLLKITGAQATVTAHHMQDQAETVLKRLFESAPLLRLAGMKAVTDIEGGRVLRPWLTTSKDTIVEYSKQRGLNPFQDPTNFSDKYLRGKIRTKLFPVLQETFNRPTSNALNHLTQEVARIHDYLLEKSAPLIEKIEKGPFGEWADLTGLNFHPEEFRIFLKYWLDNKKATLTDEHIDIIFKHLPLSGKNFTLGCTTLSVDRMRLFLLPHTHLNKDATTFWKISEMRTTEPLKGALWKDVLKGSFNLVLPAGKWQVSNYAPGLKVSSKKTLRTHYTDKKTPKIVTPLVPLIIDDQERQVIAEALSGFVKQDTHGADRILISFEANLS